MSLNTREFVPHWKTGPADILPAAVPPAAANAVQRTTNDLSDAPERRDRVGTAGGAGRIDAPCAFDFVHRLRFTRDLFSPANATLRDVLDIDPTSPRRVLVAIDGGVAAAWPMLATRIAEYAAAHPQAMRLASAPVVVDGGEQVKNSSATVDAILKAIHAHGIDRRSYVLAIGGGAVLDAVGYASAIAHRGVRLIRVPTTTLAQDDAAVGVKNGINGFGKKNFIGTFAPPWAVLNDEMFLTSLSDRDFLCGLSEAVKVAVVRDGAFFDAIERGAARLAARDMAIAVPVVRRSAELHLRHIVDGGDPFETKEARPLDFGHWSAHKLEQLTRFEVRHGEAVAVGVALDSLYAARTGKIAAAEAERIIAVLTALRLPTSHAALADNDALAAGLEEFREHLGGRLTISLPRSIGVAEDMHHVDVKLMHECMDELRRR